MPRLKVRRQQRAPQQFRTRQQAVAHYTTKAQSAAPAPATPSTPIVKKTTVHVNTKAPKLPDFTGTPGMVVLAGGTLFIAATWEDFWKPFFSSWSSDTATPLKTNVDGRLVIGGIFFLILLAVLASISHEAGGVMILMILAMWLVFIIFKGGQAPQGKQTSQLQDFFDWFSSGTPANQQTKPPAPTQTQVPAGKPTRVS